MDRRWLFGILAIVVTVGGVFFLRSNLPSLVEISPSDGETHVAIASPLMMTFSEEMQAQTVTKNLQIEPSMQGSFSWEANTLIFTPAQSWPSGEVITVTLEAGARSTWGLPLLREQQWSFSISPPLLVYLWPSASPPDLYTIDLTENIVTRLTTQPNGILAYDVSVDGAQIYYSARLNAQNSAIFRLDRVDGSISQVLLCTNVLCNFPQLSPDGNYLAYTYSHSNPDSEPFPRQVWLLPMDESITPSESQASIVSDPVHEAGAPFWSPTGLLTFHDRDAQHFVVLNPQTNERVFFANETGESGTWSPDGTDYVVAEVEFWGSGPMDFSSHLWRFEYPTAQSTKLSSDLSLEDVTPAYSPDGKQIAFGRKYLDNARWTPGSQFWLINADGSNPRQITNNPDYNNADFAWHPNGQYLSFVRHQQTNMSEPPEIWIMPADGSNAVRLVIDGYAPQWIP
jgi:dipeptidyl aminopeptidase/acylaminoacyl peptidase